MCIFCGYLLCITLLTPTSGNGHRTQSCVQQAHKYSTRKLGVCVCSHPEWTIRVDKQQQLVATAHGDRTVRVWRHLEASALSATIGLQECCRSLSRQCWQGNVVGQHFLCERKAFRLEWERLERANVQRERRARWWAAPKQQLGKRRIWSWCSAQDTFIAYDKESESLLTQHLRGILLNCPENILKMLIWIERKLIQ